MSRVRYASSLRDLERARQLGDGILESTVRSIRCAYETDSEVAQAVVPRPLEALTDPMVHVSFSMLAMSISPEVSVEIGAASFGVGVHYDGREGIYPLTMLVTTEAAVIAGRERFGEPNKLARIDFELRGERVAARVERMGIEFLAVRAEHAELLKPREQTDELYCFKAFPGCQPDKGFDQDPQLVRLEWRHRFERVVRLEGSLELVDSPFDPVADLPVRRMVSLEYTEGRTRSSGRVLRPVPGDWLLPFLQQRNDDPEIEGLDV